MLIYFRIIVCCTVDGRWKHRKGQVGALPGKKVNYKLFGEMNGQPIVTSGSIKTGTHTKSLMQYWTINS